MTSACEYYQGGEEPADADVHDAKTIIWYDQRTPLFVCAACHDHAHVLRFEGDATAADYDDRRAQAYRRLFAESPDCDVCTGRLSEKVEL